MHENYDLDQSVIYQFIVFQKEALPGGVPFHPSKF